MNLNRKYKLGTRQLKVLIIILVVLSVVFLFLSPYEEIINDLSVNAFWLVPLLVLFELLFMAGLLIMAYSIGHDLGPNIFKWRSKFHELSKIIPQDIIFWRGFWINATGAVGTAIVLIVGVIKILPPQSWGIMLLALSDLATTILLRVAIVDLNKEIQNE